MANFKVESPIHIIEYQKNKAVKTALNFNRVRNMQGFVYGRLKEQYTQLMLPRVAHLPQFNKIELEYHLYTGSNHKSDVMNWISVVDKFFQDVLVKAGKLPDDNFEYVPVITSRFMRVDKKNPRCEIIIKLRP